MSTQRHACFLSQLKHKCARAGYDLQVRRGLGSVFIGLYVTDFNGVYGSATIPYTKRWTIQETFADAVDHFGESTIFIYCRKTNTLYYRAGFGRKLTQAGVKW